VIHAVGFAFKEYNNTSIVSVKALLFRRRSIDKITLSVKMKGITMCWGFYLLNAGNVRLNTENWKVYLFKNQNSRLF